MRHTTFVGIVPAGEVLLSDAVDSLDAQLVDERLWTFLNIKKCTDKTAYIDHNPDNALHGFNLAKPFNGGLCFGSMGVRHFKCPFVASIFFGSTQGKELGRIILIYKGKDRDSA